MAEPSGIDTGSVWQIALWAVWINHTNKPTYFVMSIDSSFHEVQIPALLFIQPWAKIRTLFQALKLPEPFLCRNSCKFVVLFSLNLHVTHGFLQNMITRSHGQENRMISNLFHCGIQLEIHVFERVLVGVSVPRPLCMYVYTCSSFLQFVIPTWISLLQLCWWVRTPWCAKPSVVIWITTQIWRSCCHTSRAMLALSSPRMIFLKWERKFLQTG